MTHRRPLLALEMLVLFFGVPAVILAGNLGRANGILITAAVAYAAVQMRVARIPDRSAFGLQRFRDFRGFKPVLIRFAAFALVSTGAVALSSPEHLFGPPRQSPLFWLLMLMVYCLFSVYPQTLIYRGFFMPRYAELFRTRGALVLANALAFSWAHTIIHNPLVYVLTFFGGILFSSTWLKSGSLLAVSVEHALYGFWLFTVGLGMYFGFPQTPFSA